MKFLKKIFSFTWTYKFFNNIANLIDYIKDYNHISDTLYSDEFKTVLKRYLNLNIKKDWIGRLYGVINPNIDIDGHLNLSNTIIEIDGDNTNSEAYVRNWLYKQLDMVGNLFKITKLYDYIDLEMKHVGPIEQDNYLIVFDIVSRKYFWEGIRKFLLQTLIYAIIAIAIIIIIH